MAYDKTTDMQTLTGSAAFLQCQNNFIALQDEALTIAAVKTFSSSPIVPTPTTDMQASTKKYVDDTAVALTGNQTVAGIKTFSTPIAVGSGGTGATAAANAASGVVVLDASSKLPAGVITLSTLTSVVNNTSILASGATFISGYVSSDTVGEDALVSIYVDGSNPPTTLVYYSVCETNVGGTTPRIGFSYMIPSGLYYKVVGTVSGGSMTFVCNKSVVS